MPASVNVEFDATRASGLPSEIIDACIDKAREAILVADMKIAGAPLCFVSDTFVAITGYSRQEALGRSCRYLQGSDRDQPEIDLIWRAINDNQSIEVTLRNYKKDGTLFYNRLRLEPIKDKSGVLTHYIGFVRDVSDLNDAQKTIDEMSHLDRTTGLLNRESFYELTKNASKLGELGIAIVKYDVVRFHDVNSGYGYAAGDLLLRAIADRLKSTEAFAIGRMGANEFAAAFHSSSGDDSEKLAAATLALLEHEYPIGDSDISLRFSAGYTHGAGEGDGIALIRNAGTALHRAKRSQFKNIQSFSGNDEAEARRRVALTAQLKLALDNREFVMHYQPKVDISTSNIIGAEALIRWSHPSLGMQPPSAFISHAEDVGMIGELDSQALEIAARFSNRINDRRRRAIPISVNLSGHEVNDPTLIERVRHICRIQDADPTLIILELTETVLVKADATVLKMIKELRQDGFGISIDDFGTGYSSLSYLDRFPISEIKIDKSFIHAIESKEINRIIVDSIIKIGACSGFNIVAEGVETEEQLAVLRQMDCPFAQGYLFGRPQDGDGFMARLEARA